MVANDPEQFLNASAKSGIPLNFAIKEFHMYNILSQIVELTANMEPKPVLKGGTALNKVYFEELQRFSEDLDFDDYTAGTRHMRFQKLENLIKGIKGYEISKGWKFKKVLRIELGYSLPNGQKDHVRVEFALQDPTVKINPVIKMSKFRIANASLGGVLTYSLEDLIARKLIALMEREEGKDIYDAALGLQKTSNVKQGIKNALKAEGRQLTPMQFVQKCKKHLSSLNPEKMRNLTNPYIPLPNRPKNWNELIKTLQQTLDSLL